MKKIFGMLLVLSACKMPAPTKTEIKYNTYVFLVEDGARNKYYTNEFRQVTATCITFMAQDSIPKKVCGDYTISLLKY